ncbi:MAG: acyltransferase [Reichenbachiella sp.]|uniref:acyltransferase family protein n=1 Tax=Reichenbachiella sp. TaxID=2184521 RepID=UPI0032975A82
MKTRNKGLDILRAVAIILVLFRHSNSDNFVQHFGWLGVDLFFVLSGFLISNLLFEEYKATKRIDIKRFFAKRAFKIFPPFYFFLLTTLTVSYLVSGESYSWNQIAAEFFYVQNYWSGIWLHTWSLAVEEHFYLLFGLLVVILTKRNMLSNQGFMIGVLTFILILSLVMRVYVSYPHRNDEFFGFFQTHLRSDGIVLGVLLSYLYHFTNSLTFLRRHKRAVLILSGVFIAPGFIFHSGGFFMNTLGLTTVNIGFTLLVLLALDFEELYERSKSRAVVLVVSWLSFVGMNSYSIYIWHLTIKDVFYSSFSFDPYLMTFSCFLLSILLGIAMSYLIEKPTLRLRNRIFV